MRELLRKYLVEVAGVAPDLLDDKERRISDLGLDSLGVVEMLFEVEDKYGFHIDDVAQFKDMTIDEVIANLERLVDEHTARKDSGVNALPQEQAL